MVQNIITDLCHHLEIGIDGNLDIGNKRVIVDTPTITLTNNILTITCDTVGASIYYTLDGSTPTANSIRYTSAVTLSNNCTIKAIAIKSNKYSAIVEETYVKPITYLTQWKIVGNSEVHSVGNLTSWKVSGNSVVDNNTILSCGDLELDGKYHVKISNGVNVYDIALDEPLRKVNDVADIIEFPSGVDGKALITRNTGAILVKDLRWQSIMVTTNSYRMLSSLVPNVKFPINNNTAANAICPKYNNVSVNQLMSQRENLSFSMSSNGYISVFELPYSNSNDPSNYIRDNNLLEFIYELDTPTTELIDVSPFSVSPTDTYTSANVVPYSAFEHTENKEIWSCGEYNPIDGKYHILVQPLGGSIADIALAEPLRMIDDVADTIEFPSDTEGKALVTRVLKENNITSYSSNVTKVVNADFYRITFYNITDKKLSTIILMAEYTRSKNPYIGQDKGLSCSTSVQNVSLYDERFNQSNSNAAFREYLQDAKLIYELATPTTELVDAPQIEEADSYSMVISQGGKAVSWSSFDTE